MNTQKNFLSNPVVVLFGALICCALWGSAFPCIKIGYKMMHIASSDTASQILYAGCRFTLAGILAVVLGSLTQRQFLLPTKASLPHILELSLLQTIYNTCFSISDWHTQRVLRLRLLKPSARLSPFSLPDFYFIRKRLRHGKCLAVLSVLPAWYLSTSPETGWTCILP